MPRFVPAERPPVVFDDRTACFFCTTQPAVWAHVLDGELIDEHGARYVIGNDLLTLCDSCEQLFAARATDELLSVARRRQDHVRSVGASLFAAARPAYRLERFVEPPEIVALLDAGYDDLDANTGAVDQLAPLWPATDHLVIADARPNRWADVGRHLVRSPWPALSVPDVLNVLWRWLERDDEHLGTPIGRARVAEVFGWTEVEALALLHGPDPRCDR